MKKILLAGVATTAIAAAVPASAADLRMPVKAAPIAAPAPYFSWSGCYVGAHAGWGWGQKDIRGFAFGSTTPLASKIDISGAIFGGQLGCNYSLQNTFIIGIEGSVSGADINGFNIGTCCSQLLRAKTDFLGSVTGKLGWSGWNPAVLFYFKGGWAFGHDRYEHTTAFQVGQQDRTGWTIGLGAEWMFAQNWSAFAEWDHYDFGTKSTTLVCGGCSETGTLTAGQVIDTVRVGVNYHFNLGFIGKSPGVVARY